MFLFIPLVGLELALRRIFVEVVAEQRADNDVQGAAETRLGYLAMSVLCTFERAVGKEVVDRVDALNMRAIKGDIWEEVKELAEDDGLTVVFPS